MGRAGPDRGVAAVRQAKIAIAIISKCFITTCELRWWCSGIEGVLCGLVCGSCAWRFVRSVYDEDRHHYR